MKNKNLKNLMGLTIVGLAKQSEITVLNKDELLYAMGGTKEVDCPMLKTCTTLSECNGKCTVDGVKVGL